MRQQLSLQQQRGSHCSSSSSSSRGSGGWLSAAPERTHGYNVARAFGVSPSRTRGSRSRTRPPRSKAPNSCILFLPAAAFSEGGDTQKPASYNAQRHSNLNALFLALGRDATQKWDPPPPTSICSSHILTLGAHFFKR